LLHCSSLLCSKRDLTEEMASEYVLFVSFKHRANLVKWCNPLSTLPQALALVQARLSSALSAVTTRRMVGESIMSVACVFNRAFTVLTNVSGSKWHFGGPLQSASSSV